MRLFIAEKPELAKAIVEGLGGGRRKEGYYDCGNDWVTWCFGHMLQLLDPEDYDQRYASWRMDDLPIAHIPWRKKPAAARSAQLRVISQLLKQADSVVHAGDPDDEGQLLVDEILTYARCRLPVQRLLINDNNTKVVRKALANLRDNREFASLSAAAEARSVGDQLYGYNLTRAYTLAARKAGYQGVLSVGRVQTPILGLVVRRDREFESHVKSFYYYVTGQFLVQGVAFPARYQVVEGDPVDDKGRLIDQQYAQAIADAVKGQAAHILSADTRQKEQPAPLPYNLLKLQTDAARKFGMKPDLVKNITQALRERHRLITYNRSDCEYLSDEHHADAPNVLAAIAQTAPMLAPASAAANPAFKSRAFNSSKVSAHHAIIPTETTADLATLSAGERKIYRPFPKRNELACCSFLRSMIECGQWTCLIRPRSIRLMDTKEMALLRSVLHFPAGITMTSAHPTATELIIRVGCHLPTMPCPGCAQPSARIHGHYQRTVCDLPCAGRTVILLLTVRRFVCTNATCSRTIFTERLPALVNSYARKTSRLLVLLQVLGLAAGGSLGSRVAERFGIAASSSTMLRIVMRLPPPKAGAVRVLGIDDFAWKKRFRYGTVLVDLDRRTIIDILPDRESATVEKWLEKHPEVEIISRDRGKEFRKAATRAAPQAQQVVDRFHLARNLTEALQVILGHCRAEIRQAEEPAPVSEKVPHPLPAPEAWQQRTPAKVEKAHQSRQASRDDRYRQIIELRAQGLTQVEIAQRVYMSERAVRTWLKRGAAPTWKRRSRRRSVFDPYAAYVLKRWQEGVREVKQLYEEIRAQGFPGTVRIVGRFLQTLRDDPERLPLPPATGADHFSSKTAAFLFIRDPKQLTSEQQADLELICQRSETARQTYELTQQFMTMLRERRGQEFELWVQAVEASQIAELKRFAHSLSQEKDAVKAGLTLEVSNGPVEAQVQKLKVVKRAMYGTAKPPLLRQRLLHAI